MVTAPTKRFPDLSGPLLQLASGAKALYLIARFGDEAAAQEAIRHDVSVGLEDGWIDGEHNVYDGTVLNHVALTSEPVVPGLGPWQFVKQDASGIYYSKELLPEGEFYKAVLDQTVDIQQSTLQEVKENHTSMLSNGVGCPLRMTHNSDGNQLGEVVDLVIANRSRSVQASQAKKHKASRLLQLSFKGSTIMNLDELGAMLGLAFTEDMDDAAKAEAIKTKIAALNAASPGEGEGGPTPPPVSTTAPAMSVAASNAPTAPTTPPVAPTAPTVAPTQTANLGAAVASVVAAGGGVRFSAESWPESTVLSVRDNGVTKLKELVNSGALTPAAKDVAEAEFLTKAKVRIQMSREANGVTIDDAFGSLLKVLRANDPKAAWKESGREPATASDVELVNMSRNSQKSPMDLVRSQREEKEKPDGVKPHAFADCVVH